MKLPVPLLRLVVCLIAMSAGFSSSALTLGRAQGLPLIGRPLDVGVPLTLESGVDLAALCLEADVFYGDTRLDAGRVTTRLDAVSGTAATVRVRSALSVDEPVVTLVVRVGCRQKIARRYVLLAELLPVETAGPATDPTAQQPQGSVLPPQSQTGGVASPARTGDATSSAIKTPASRAQAAGRNVSVNRQSAATSAATGTSVATAAGASVPLRARAKPPERARLRLDPLDAAIDRDPGLKVTAYLGAVTDATPERRAEAAALWQALNAQPEEVLRNARRMTSMEGDIKGLRDTLAVNSASLAELRGQLEKTPLERFLAPVVAALLALLLLAAGLLWRRDRRRSTGGPAGRQGADWWRGPDRTGGSDFSHDSMPSAQSALRSAPAGKLKASLDFDLSFPAPLPDNGPRRHAEARRAGGVRSEEGPSTGGELSDLHHGEPASLRAVKVDELHDVQEQADFFISLGEHEQAIQILRNHIGGHPETSAVAWLALLEICHKLQRREDFEWVREDFHRVLNAQVPAFDAYTEQSAGLEAYDEALSRIVALWPSPKVLEIIEESIFRRPGAAGVRAFSLEAYRELLLLHGIGKEVIGDISAPADPTLPLGVPAERPDFFHTSIQPLSAAMTGTGSTGMGLSRIGLDIDLDEPVQPLKIKSHKG